MTYIWRELESLMGNQDNKPRCTPYLGTEITWHFPNESKKMFGRLFPLFPVFGLFRKLRNADRLKQFDIINALAFYFTVKVDFKILSI